MILDDFAENWLKWKDAEAKIRESLPKTPEEADERFKEEMGNHFHNILYTLREEVYKYFNNPGNVPLDAFIPSALAENAYHAIVNLQSEMSEKDLLP